jgi:uncharacterized protein YbaR (Trm112 family)
MTLPERLVEILVCPRCRGRVEIGASASFLICCCCGLAYPVRGGIPEMVVEDAVPLSSLSSAGEVTVPLESVHRHEDSHCQDQRPR